MIPVCDLHAHSCFSDGTYTPEELVAEAKRIGLKAVALTDHNNVDGLPRFLAAAEKAGIEAVPGVEFSTDYHGIELHVLMLFIQPKHYDAVKSVLHDFHKRKEQSNRDLIDNLNKAGIAISYDDVCKRTPTGFVNRAVIASELVEKSYVSSVKEGFQKYLSEKNGFYVPAKRTDVYEMIRFIKELGGVTVLAHPFLNLDEAALRAFLPEAIAAGLDAIETMYSKYDELTTRTAMNIAEEFGILHSGGSDFHGKTKPDIALGRGRGNLLIPYSVLENLKCRNKNFVELG